MNTVPLGYHNICDVDRLNKQLADAQALELLLREEVSRVHDLHAKALHETELQKARADHWRNLADSIDGSGISRFDHMLETVLQVLMDGHPQKALIA